MWYLTSKNDNRVMYIVSSDNQIVIGRSVDNQVCDFAIPDDPSISRRHVTLAITDNSLFLQDMGSRYGTFINDEKVEVNTNIKLNENDVVKFGKMNSIWKVNVINLITCTSTLKGENLQNLKLILSKLGGMLKSDWDETCNYLTMPAITLTIKVVLALVEGSYIVTTEFWNKCSESVTNLIPLPNPCDFMPHVVESTLNREVVSFLPDSRRKTLFEGIKFIFFSRRQYEMYKTVLVKSGASPMLLSECRMSISMLCSQDIIVIQYIASGASQETQSQKKTISDIVYQLKNKGKRVVADAEIGLAILYCSMDKYCNPNFSFMSEVVKQTSEPLKSSKVLVQESQEPVSQQKKENVKIDESLMSEDNNENHAVKRKLSELASKIHENPNKKLAITNITPTVKIEGSKRRLSDNDNESLNPSKKIAVDKQENTNEIVLNTHEQDENQNSDDIFNFVKTVPTNSGIENKAKKLNLSRPQKRKNDNNEDENLFNFVQSNNDDKGNTNNSKESVFNMFKRKKDLNDEIEETIVTKPKGVSVEDISAMRGSKLKELMDCNSSNTDALNIIKKEKTEQVELQMGKLDLCSTIVTTCNNLIVKREPYKTESEHSLDKNMSVKNFKTFKKVWPIKRQSTIVHASAMSFGNNTESRSLSFTT